MNQSPFESRLRAALLEAIARDSSFRHRRRAITVGLGVITILLVCGVAVLSQVTETPPTTVDDHALLGEFSSASPLGPTGVKTTLENATEDSEFYVARPRAGNASDAEVIAVWMRTGELPEVVIAYSSGLRAYIAPWPDELIPADFYEKQMSEGVEGKLLTVGGWPALEISASDFGPASLDMVVEGVNVRLIDVGGKLSMADLEAAARTVA